MVHVQDDIGSQRVGIEVSGVGSSVADDAGSVAQAMGARDGVQSSVDIFEDGGRAFGIVLIFSGSRFFQCKSGIVGGDGGAGDEGAGGEVDMVDAIEFGK